MSTLFATRWLEVEPGWGDRPEGFKVFKDRNDCEATTKKDSEIGHYEGGGGYCGPVRPLVFYEIALEEFEDSVQEKIKVNGTTFTSNHWKPKKTLRQYTIDQENT